MSLCSVRIRRHIRQQYRSSVHVRNPTRTPCELERARGSGATVASVLRCRPSTYAGCHVFRAFVGWLAARYSNLGVVFSMARGRLKPRLAWCEWAFRAVKEHPTTMSSVAVRLQKACIREGPGVGSGRSWYIHATSHYRTLFHSDPDDDSWLASSIPLRQRSECQYCLLTLSGL
jgi:hypothetical protein